MILSDREIRMEMESGRLRFNPAIEDGQISPSSIDLRLSNQFTIFKRNTPGVEMVIDMEQVTNLETTLESLSIRRDLDEGETLTLSPGDFVLAYTREYVELPNYLAARVEGRSSYARLGISVHQTAPTIHATFSGQIRLEISHNGPYSCKLSPGSKICQMIIERLGSPAERSLRSQFQRQRPVSESPTL